MPTLDGWRAVAIIAVIGYHANWPNPVLQQLFRNGNWGVQLFFALSGFLITCRLIDEHARSGRISWTNFYIRRAFRILPAAFFFLIAIAVLGDVFHLIPVTRSQLLASALFYRNYLFGPGPLAPGWYTGHFWTLAVEEHFYLFWPAVLCVVGISRGGRAATALAFLAVAWRIADRRFGWIAHFFPNQLANAGRTDYVISQMFWGCALAFAWHHKPFRLFLERHVRSYWTFGAVCMIVGLLHYKPKNYAIGLELLIAALPLLTIARPGGMAGRILESAPMKRIGTLSYSLYLWQQLFVPIFWVPKALGRVQELPLNLALAFAAAWFSYSFIERPLIEFGKGIQRRRGAKPLGDVRVEMPSSNVSDTPRRFTANQ